MIDWESRQKVFITLWQGKEKRENLVIRDVVVGQQVLLKTDSYLGQQSKADFLPHQV